MRRAFFSTLFRLACLGSVTRFAVSASLEYELKAAFLLRFANFVEWPPAAFANAGEPLVFGVFGNDPFDGALDEAAKGKIINGRRVLIRISADPTILRTCHVVFFPASQMRRYTAVVSSLSESSVLTVGEAGDFTNRGGIINFIMKDDQLRFEINSTAAATRHLKVSSRLLQLSVKAARPQ